MEPCLTGEGFCSSDGRSLLHQQDKWFVLLLFVTYRTSNQQDSVFLTGTPGGPDGFQMWSVGLTSNQDGRFMPSFYLLPVIHVM